MPTKSDSYPRHHHSEVAPALTAGWSEKRGPREARSLEALNERARASGVTGVLSVGLAPGITNLLVCQVQDVLGAVRTAEITVLLGLGDTHGRDAIRWMLENSRALGESKRIQLPEPYGKRTARERPMPSISPTSTSFGTLFR